jgi:hypothetical protein
MELVNSSVKPVDSGLCSPPWGDLLDPSLSTYGNFELNRNEVDTIPVLKWNDPERTSVRTDNVPVEIQTDDLLETKS